MSGWFPAVESHNVVGRVVEHEKVHPAKSRERGEAVYVMVPVMEAKVLKDSSDVSTQEIKPQNEGEFKKIIARFPGAWDAYIKSKGSALGEVQELAPIKGTPIDKALAFLPKEKVGYLKTIGFTTLEQLAEMSDAQVVSMGTGARTWRKKAAQLLKG